jgi:hypothetical protein
MKLWETLSKSRIRLERASPEAKDPEDEVEPIRRIGKFPEGRGGVGTLEGASRRARYGDSRHNAPLPAGPRDDGIGTFRQAYGTGWET